MVLEPCPHVIQAGAFGEEHPKVAAVRASARERLQKQEEAEARAKESLVKQAAGYLETFYQVYYLGLCSAMLPVLCQWHFMCFFFNFSGLPFC